MDDKRFDALAKTLVAGASRRGIAKGAVGGALAGVLSRLATGAGTAQERGVGAEVCTANGEPCGGRRPSCDRCCSDYSVRVRSGKRRRCSCKPAGVECSARRPFQCCSGVCNGGFCTGRGELIERGDGTIKTTSEAGCQFTEAGCTNVIEGDVEGRPIDGDFTGTLTGTNFQPGAGPGDFTSDVTGTVTLTDDSSDDTLEVKIEGTQTGNDDTGAFDFTGTYTIIGGTGRFVDASGSGTATASGEGDTLDSVELRGTITTVG